MKADELREHATCSICSKPIGHTGLPLFWRATIERFGIDMQAVSRQSGLELMTGNIILAAALGNDKDMASPVMETVVLTFCDSCASRADFPIAHLIEYA